MIKNFNKRMFLCILKKNAIIFHSNYTCYKSKLQEIIKLCLKKN